MTIEMPRGAKFIIARLHEKGYEAYLVGGCVRDACLGKAPSDFDITTSALPEETKALFSDVETVDTGLRHGTLTVVLEDGTYEVTTYRVDNGYTDARHPDMVSFTRSLREDAARRDFTVNAMAYSDESGVVDFYGGQEDLHAGIIRTVGDPALRFSEDALRILRALRFSATLGFAIEENTAMQALSLRGSLHKISAERIREELLKLICGKDAMRVLSEFREVIAEAIPELVPTFDFDQKTPHHIYDLYSHTLAVVAGVPQTPRLRMAALLHDIGKPRAFFTDENGVGHFYGHEAIGADMAREILSRLRFSTADSEYIVTLVLYHGVPVPETPRMARKLLSKLGEDLYFALMQLKRADNLALSPMHAARVADIENAERMAREIIESRSCFTLGSLAISGKDLIGLGMKPGKEIGRILNATLEAVMDEKLPNEREALLSFAETMMRK